jgi:hypothetical protein
LPHSFFAFFLFSFFFFLFRSPLLYTPPTHSTHQCSPQRRTLESSDPRSPNLQPPARLHPRSRARSRSRALTHTLTLTRNLTHARTHACTHARTPSLPSPPLHLPLPLSLRTSTPLLLSQPRFPHLFLAFTPFHPLPYSRRPALWPPKPGSLAEARVRLLFLAPPCPTLLCLTLPCIASPRHVSPCLALPRLALLCLADEPVRAPPSAPAAASDGHRLCRRFLTRRSAAGRRVRGRRGDGGPGTKRRKGEGAKGEGTKGRGILRSRIVRRRSGRLGSGERFCEW